jgi:hypothetical protein
MSSSASPSVSPAPAMISRASSIALCRAASMGASMPACRHMRVRRRWAQLPSIAGCRSQMRSQRRPLGRSTMSPLRQTRVRRFRVRIWADGARVRSAPMAGRFCRFYNSVA